MMFFKKFTNENASEKVTVKERLAYACILTEIFRILYHLFLQTIIYFGSFHFPYFFLYLAGVIPVCCRKIFPK